MSYESSAESIIDALHPAQIETVILHPRFSRAIAVMREDQVAVALGKQLSRVREASRSTGWDIEVMTPDEWDRIRYDAQTAFSHLRQSNQCVGKRLVDEGIVTYHDLITSAADEVIRITGLAPSDAETIVAQARRQLNEDSRET